MQHEFWKGCRDDLSLSKFNIGVTAFWKNRNKSGTYDAWCDGAMVWCNGAMVRCDGTVRWCDGTVRWCDGTLRWCDGTVRWYGAMVRWCDGTVRWCDGTVRWCDGMVRWCDGTVRWYAIVCDGTQLHAPWGWGGVMVWLHWSMAPVMFCDSILMNHGMLYWCGTMVSCNTGSCVQSHNHLPVIVIYFFIIFLSCTTSKTK